MGKIIKAIISETNGSPSALRVMALYCVVAASGLAAYGLYKGADLTGLAALCAAFIAPAFAAKVTQRHIETKDK